MNESGTKHIPVYYLRHKANSKRVATAYHLTDNKYILNSFYPYEHRGMICDSTMIYKELPLELFNIISEEEYFLEIL